MIVINAATLGRWRAEPSLFIEEVLHDPETGEPFKLLDAEREFLKHAFKLNAVGKLVYPEQLYAAPKKSGKTAFAAIHMLTTLLLYGGPFGEGYAIANDLEQAISRVFQAVRRIVEASPLLKREAKITQDRVTFPAFQGATISAIASDYTGAAGANPNISTFDEPWGITSERGHRLFDEMIPPPTRKIALRLAVSYAGWSGESILLEGLYKRGLAQPLIGPSLYAGDGLLMFWTHEPVAPWQDEAWLTQMRRDLRPNQFLRMIQNKFVTSESSFVNLGKWDACTVADLRPVVTDKSLYVWVGVDASTKHDSTAIVGVTWDRRTKQVRLVFHRVFQPTPDKPLQFEATIETTLRELSTRFRFRQVLFDPWQMMAVSQRLAAAGLPVQEFPQTSSNLTAASQNLFDLIEGGNIVLYADHNMRLAVSRAVAVESPRGWRISKEKQSHKIDVIVALAMAAHAAVIGSSEPYFDSSYSAFQPDAVDGESPDRLPPDIQGKTSNSYAIQQFQDYVNNGFSFGGPRWR